MGITKKHFGTKLHFEEKLKIFFQGHFYTRIIDVSLNDILLTL